MPPKAASRNQVACSFPEARWKERNEVFAQSQTLSTKLFQIVIAFKLGSPEDVPGGHWCQMRGIKAGLGKSGEQQLAGWGGLQNFPVGSA